MGEWGVGGSFYILPGEERGIKEREERGERGKEAICGCLKRGAGGVSCRIPDC